MKEVEKEVNYIEDEIADAIMEIPYSFSVKHRRFFLYPITIGKALITSKIVKMLDFNSHVYATNPYIEALRLSHTDIDNVCMLIDYHPFDKKEDICDVARVRKRAKFFKENVEKEDLAQLLISVTQPDRTDAFCKHIGIDKENERYRKALNAKGDSGSMSFGGKSTYGSLIDFACERYGWSLDYVIWGISRINLQMLMADMIKTIYLTEDERKKANIPKYNTLVDADNTGNLERVKEFFK